MSRELNNLMKSKVYQFSNATKLIIRNLIRDYNELEHLQASATSSNTYAGRSYSRCRSILIEELEKFNPTEIIFSDNSKIIENDGTYFYVDVINGMSNLAKSLPYFGVVITAVKIFNSEKKVIATYISFPALGEEYYAEASQGAWYQKIHEMTGATNKRLRVSACRVIQESLMAVTDISDISNSIECKSVRVFGSTAYSIACYASGKIDLAIVSKKDLACYFAAQLFASEAGGIIDSSNDDYIILKNQYL